MSRLRSALALLLLPAVAVAADPPVLDLWPGAVPGEKGNVGPEQFAPDKPNEKPPLKRLTNVTKPTLTVYRPAADKDTGAAIIIAPGGGYSILAWEHEGTMVAEWLQKLGVTGVLLKYRVPRRPDAPKDAPPVAALQDAQRAISLTRSKAAEWGIDPHRIGMLGFSAGGHLTAWAATNADRRSYPTVDVADSVSCRPDFAVLIYPGGMVDRTAKDRLAPEIRVSKDTPPCFLAVAVNDAGPLDSSVKMLQALKQAGVSAELHVFSSGGHGFGMRPADKPFAAWPQRCADWLKAEGHLTRPAK